MSTGEQEAAGPAPVVLVVYSDDPTTRERVMLAIGRQPASDVGRIEYVECSSTDEVLAELDAGGVDLAIFDGEAVPAGGMGVCRQVKSELRRCPPVLVITGRRDDRWLATWSLADASVSHPIDPILLVDAVLALLRSAAALHRAAR